MFVELDIDLASAEDDTVDFFGRSDCLVGVGGIGDDPLEVGLAGEVGERGTSKGVAEERFGEEENEGFAELTVHLAAEDVEEIGGCGHIGDLHVAVLVLAVKLLRGWEDSGVFIAELQVPLHSAGRVLWALAIIAVGKRHHQTTSLQPFDLPRSYKLINDTLTIVGKIAKLSFPYYESIRRR